MPETLDEIIEAVGVRPYFRDDAVVIYHADCRDILPRIPKVDLVLTDPPFFLPAHVATSRKRWPRRLGDLAVMGGYFTDAFEAIISRLHPTGAFYTFCDATSYPVFFSIVYPLMAKTQMIMWDKVNGGMGRGWRHSHEIILHGAFERTEYDSGFRRDVIQEPVIPSSDRHHPAEKPVAVVSALATAHPPSLILDPFMGSGTTLRAAKDLGRYAIGIEIEERYAEIAAKRMAQMVMPLSEPCQKGKA